MLRSLQVAIVCFCSIAFNHAFGQSSSSDSASFVFPLAIGNEWYYYVSNANFPGVHYSYNATIKIESDTLMPNGNIYFQVPAMEDFYAHLVNSKIYLRKEGAKLLQYSPVDSIEYVRFDFVASIGDTISGLPFDPYSGAPIQDTLLFVLSDVQSLTCFGAHRTTYTFSLAQSFGNASLVTDSLGILNQTDGFASEWTLFGARLQGKEYGTPLSVGQPRVTATPTEFRLYQNFPNPFNPSTVIPYDLPKAMHIRLCLFDCLGRELKVVADKFEPAGHHEILVNTHDWPSGMYFYRINSLNQSSTRKMLLLK